MQVLIIINDAIHGTEKACNALRLATQVQKDNKNAEVVIFLMSDAVSCAIPGQQTPVGFHNIERMLKAATDNRGRI